MGKRTRYSKEVKEQVRLRYPLCRTTADKKELARELGIGSVSRLYNLASRLSVAGSGADRSAVERQSQADLISDPAEVRFSRKADQYLRREFGRRPIEDIAFHLHLSETAVTYRARHLGLRRPVRFWRQEKVAAWLGKSIDQLVELEDQGLEFFPMAGPDGLLELTVVSTSSLARWLKGKKRRDELLAAGADPFFLLEIEESVQALVNEESDFERCAFLSHGHVCMNPLSKASYGYYCTNNDVYKAGDDPKCHVKVLKVEDLAPEG